MVPHNCIHRWLTQAWKRAEMDKLYPDYLPSLTANRKLVTTSAREADSSRADDVAFMLCHRRKTADSHYDARLSKSRSQSTYSWLQHTAVKPKAPLSSPPTLPAATSTAPVIAVSSPPPPPAATSTAPVIAVSSPPPPPAATSTAPVIAVSSHPPPHAGTSKTQDAAVSSLPPPVRKLLKRHMIRDCSVTIKKVAQDPAPAPAPATAPAPAGPSVQRLSMEERVEQEDERVDELMSARDDLEAALRSAEQDLAEQEQEKSPEKKRLTKKIRDIWTESETREIEQAYADDIQACLEDNCTIPMETVRARRNGRWGRFTTDRSDKRSGPW